MQDSRFPLVGFGNVLDYGTYLTKSDFPATQMRVGRNTFLPYLILMGLAHTEFGHRCCFFNSFDGIDFNFHNITISFEQAFVQNKKKIIGWSKT
jgi:hypothetical protein